LHPGQLVLRLSRLLGIASDRTGYGCLVQVDSTGDDRYPGNISAEQICRLAQSGDELAARAVERESYYLGLAWRI